MGKDALHPFGPPRKVCEAWGTGISGGMQSKGLHYYFSHCAIAVPATLQGTKHRIGSHSNRGKGTGGGGEARVDAIESI